MKRKIVDFALQETELSPRESAVTFTDQERYFVSESTVYRALKAHDLITSPAFIVMKAASEFKGKTNAIKQLWKTDFTYIKGSAEVGSIAARFSTTTTYTSSPLPGRRLP